MSKVIIIDSGMKIGTKLRQLRVKKGFSQEYLADRLGMSQSNYSKLESDKYENFAWDILPNLANIYEIDIMDIFEDLGIKLLNNSKNNDYATNAFYVVQNSDNKNEEVTKSLWEIINSQKEIIAFLTTQLDFYKQKQ